MMQSTPRRGFSNNKHALVYRELNLRQLQKWITNGRLDTEKLITMKELRDCGLISKRCNTGVKLLGKGAEDFKSKISIEVSKISENAKKVIQDQGGTVESVYYNPLGLRALMRPEWFKDKGRLIPKMVRQIPPKHIGKFDRLGTLPAV